MKIKLTGLDELTSSDEKKFFYSGEMSAHIDLKNQFFILTTFVHDVSYEEAKRAILVEVENFGKNLTALASKECALLE
jgi:hypothetical protein